MTPLFKKLNFKEQDELLILNYPESFTKELNSISAFVPVQNEVKIVDSFSFCLVFVQTVEEVEALSISLDKLRSGDAILWFAFPKKSSKRYNSEINRDYGWASLGALEYEAVRAVAIDEDWSAIRFRKVDYIKTMKRSKSFAMTEKGKAKTTDRGRNNT